MDRMDKGITEAATDDVPKTVCIDLQYVSLSNVLPPEINKKQLNEPHMFTMDTNKQVREVIAAISVSSLIRDLTYRVDIMYEEHVLPGSMTLSDIIQIFEVGAKENLKLFWGIAYDLEAIEASIASDKMAQ